MFNYFIDWLLKLVIAYNALKLVSRQISFYHFFSSFFILINANHTRLFIKLLNPIKFIVRIRNKSIDYWIDINDALLIKHLVFMIDQL